MAGIVLDYLLPNTYYLINLRLYKNPWSFVRKCCLWNHPVTPANDGPVKAFSRMTFYVSRDWIDLTAGSL